MKENPEVYNLFNSWIDRTIEIHEDELSKQDIGDTEALRKSIAKHLRRLGEGYIEGGLIFLEHGRFVDMGSGRGYSFGKSTRGMFDLDTPRRGRRKKKPWYSKVFYARINDLQGAVGFKLMEQAINIGREELKAHL